LLPATVQARLEDAACRLAATFGLRWSMFIAEFFWDEATDRIGTVEINPRLSGHFADLYEKVDGVNGNRIALELACGRAPRVQRRAGAYGCAASFPLRVFEPVRVLRAPDEADAAAARALVPGTLVWNEVHAGDHLTDFSSGDDGQSYRYAVVNIGAASAAALEHERDRIVERLRYRFEPVVT
jgi:biotin carboxylase